MLEGEKSAAMTFRIDTHSPIEWQRLQNQIVLATRTAIAKVRAIFLAEWFVVQRRLKRDLEKQFVQVTTIFVHALYSPWRVGRTRQQPRVLNQFQRRAFGCKISAVAANGYILVRMIEVLTVKQTTNSGQNTLSTINRLGNWYEAL